MSPLTFTTIQEIDLIHDELRKSYRSGKAKSLEFRKKQLLGLYNLLDDNIDRFNAALYADLGRSPAENDLLEFGSSMGDAKLAHDNLEKWTKTEAVPWSFNYWMSKPAVRRESKGVVVIISPFNYPLWISWGPIAGAIAAGNAVVLKPSELVPNTCALIAELFPKYLDSSLYRIINGAVTETTHLLTLQWDHIMYTGSGRVGRIVATAAAKHLTPVTLELGGKSPVFVDPACDLKVAARRILWGKTANAGQTCCAPDYILVPQEGLEPLLKELESVYAEFYPQGPANSTSYCKIVSDGHFERLKGLLDSTSGTIVMGGETDPSKRFIAPTIVKNVQAGDSLMSEELFGPLLPIITVKNVDEALDFVNSRDHPLALYVFTQSPEFKIKVFDNTHSGSAIANDCMIHCVVDGLPFGGTGASGYGCSTGKYSFDMFTHLRSTMDNPGWTDIIMKMRFPPYTEAKARTIKSNLYTSPPKTKRSGWGWIFLITAIVGVLSVYLKSRGSLLNLASDIRSLIGL